MLNEIVKPRTTANNSFSLKMKWFNSKIRVDHKASYLKQDKVTFPSRNLVYLIIVYELGTWSQKWSD